VKSIFEFTGFDIAAPRGEAPTDALVFEHEVYQFLASSANAQLVEAELALPFMPDHQEHHQRALERRQSSIAHVDVERLYRLEDILRSDFSDLPPLEIARYWFLLGTGALNLGRWHDAMDSFTTCAYLLENPELASQRIQLYYYWGRAALHAQRAQEATLSLKHALTTFRHLSREHRQACLRRDYESFDCYLSTQLSRAESLSGQLMNARSYTESALDTIANWIARQLPEGATLPKRRRGEIPLQAIRPEIWRSSDPDDQIWGALALTIPWHDAEYATWQARLHDPQHHQQRNHILKEHAYEPMRNLIANTRAAFTLDNGDLDAREQAGLLNLHLSTLDIALSGVRIGQGSEHALQWLPRAVGAVREIEQHFPGTVTDPEQQTYFALQRDAADFHTYLLADLPTQPVIARIHRQADELKQQGQVWLSGCAERLLGQCYRDTKNPIAAKEHYQIALDCFEAERSPHAFSPHSAEVQLALDELQHVR
jgi:tetratricopeptide (TPR) repeat protein